MLLEQHRSALAKTAFAPLPEVVQEALVDGAVFFDVPASGTFLRGDGPVFASIVVEGLIRTYLVNREGRELTVRYTRPGDVNGVTALYTRPLANISQAAITDSRVLALRSATVVALAEQEPAVANVLLRDLAERAASYIHALASTTLSPLPENVVRHLLDIASVDDDGRLVARLSQQHLASNVGTVREVVGRILRELRDEGLISLGRDEIVLLDAERLHDRTWPRAW